MAKLAFLGTGLIGAGMVEGARRRGEIVRVWNRTFEKAKALEAAGARAFSSPAEAVAGVDRVHLALKDDATVDAVIDACSVSLGNAVIVDHTTTSPAGARARADRLLREGIQYLHAPVFMSPKLCREAGGIMLVSGPREIFARVEVGLKTMTGMVDYLGERPDLAAAHKLFGNAMILTITAGFADVLAMATALNIPPGEAHALFTKFNAAATLTYRGASMAAGNYEASFELAMARKDARLMIEAAGSEKKLAVLPAVAARIDQLLARGHARDDLGVLSIDSVPAKKQRGS